MRRVVNAILLVISYVLFGLVIWTTLKIVRRSEPAGFCCESVFLGSGTGDYFYRCTDGKTYRAKEVSP